MKRLVVHPSTKKQLAGLSQKPGHAMMLVGPEGIGKLSLAVELAEKVLEINDFTSYAYGRVIGSQNGKSVGIETVRELESFLSLKVPGKSRYNRVVIIKDAQNLSLEAQNALLKTLEEPPKGTVIMLTVHHVHALLPTIVSRSQVVHVNRPGKEALQAHFNADSDLVDRAYSITGGVPGLMSQILEQDDHPLRQATDVARNLLSKTVYERLLLVDELSKNNELARNTVFVLQQMAHSGLKSGRTPERWQRVSEASYEAAERLANNAQNKLVLDKLMLYL